MDFTSGAVGKESACQCRRCGFDPWVGKIPWLGNGNTPVFLPGKLHGQRNLVEVSPWGHKESDTTEHILAGWLWSTFLPIVDLQRCVSFRCTVILHKYMNIHVYIHMYIFGFFFII